MNPNYKLTYSVVEYRKPLYTVVEQGSGEGMSHTWSYGTFDSKDQAEKVAALLNKRDLK